MPEPANVDVLMQLCYAELTHPEHVERAEMAAIVRLVWNMRGAAYIAKLEWAFDPEVSNGQPSMKTLDQVLRTLDRVRRRRTS